MKRHTRLALEWVGGAFALVAVLAVAAALVLANGSVELDFLAPFLAASLSNPASGVQVTIGQARLALAAGPRLEIVARGVELRVGTAGPQIALPELDVDLSVGAALRGVIAPTRITLDRPQLRLARDVDGGFHLGFDTAQGASDSYLGQILRDLSAAPDPTAPAGALTELTIRRADFLFDDRALGVVWRASGDLSLQRDASGLHGAVTLSEASAPSAAIHAEIDYVRSAARVEARLDFRDLLPSSWATASPALTPLRALDVPITGTVRATIDPERGAIVAASCDLRLGAGAWRDPVLADGALAITEGAVVAAYDPTHGRLNLDRLALELGGPSLLLRGTVDGVGGGLLTGGWPRVLDAALTVDASDVPIAAVPRVWPPALSPRVRRWVLANVHAGTVERTTSSLGLHVDLDAADPVALRTLSGTMAYRDLTIDTVGKLPQVTGIGGTGSFTLADMVLQPTSGSLLGLAIGTAKVSLTKLDVPDPTRVAIDATLTGPLKDALTVLDTEPLNYLRAFGIAPASVAGQVGGRVTLAFPLTERVEPRHIDVTADASLTGVAIPHAVLGRDVTAGTVTVRLDRDALTIDGTAALAGVPISIGARRTLGTATAEPLTATVRAKIDDAGRRALGIDFFPESVTGPVGIDLAFAEGTAGAQAQVSLDLTGAGLAIPLLSWTKGPGSPATARFGANFSGARIASLHDIVFHGGGLEAQLAASFDESGLSRVDVARLAVGATEAGGTLVRRDDGGWRIDVEGAAFDATGLADLASHAAPANQPEPPFELDVKLDRVVLGSGREAQNARAHLVSDGEHWRTATADATLAGGAPVRLRYGPAGGKQHFSLHSDDFGGLLHLVGVAQNVRGGRIQVTGNAVDDGPQRRLRVAVEGEDFRLLNAPMVARLLSVASFSGMLSLLSGDGIPFSRLSANVLYGADRLVIDDFRTYGAVIGVNASGIVDQQARTIDVTGTLVPSFRLNTVLGDIPTIGNWLLGGAGQGLFGANFRIAGAVDNPTVSVNMLSALAPGALRNLFRF